MTNPAHPKSWQVILPAGYFSFLLCLFTLAACARVRIDLSAPSPAAPTPAPVLAPTFTPRPPTATPRPTPAAITTPTPPACPLPELRQGQFISASRSFTQTEPAAAGPMACRIKRDTCAYRQLVGIVDPSIVYKQEELPPFNTEDFLIHPAMVAPLSKLNQLVQAEWGGAVQLRVTDAYDSQLDHDPPQTAERRAYSLHYEGRAIDLTLWPIDRSRYSRLCALAHCAGFDWVLNEGTHCHASIRATSLCVACQE